MEEGSKGSNSKRTYKTMREIGIKELHGKAREVSYYEFQIWVARELFNQSETIDSKKLTDKLKLYVK